MRRLPRARLIYELDTQQASLATILPSVENEEAIEQAGDLDISHNPEECILCEGDLIYPFPYPYSNNY